MIHEDMSAEQIYAELMGSFTQKVAHARLKHDTQKAWTIYRLACHKAYDKYLTDTRHDHYNEVVDACINRYLTVANNTMQEYVNDVNCPNVDPADFLGPIYETTKIEPLKQAYNLTLNPGLGKTSYKPPKAWKNLK